MQKEYKNLYFLMTKHSGLPSNCLPINSKGKSPSNITKLMEINRSIVDIMDPESHSTPQKKRKKDSQLLSFEKTSLADKLETRRIHNNFTYFASVGQGQTTSNKFIGTDDYDSAKKQFVTIPAKGSSATISRRKDLYDDHIDKYMKTKYDDQEAIQKYLTNREQFIKQACKEIEHEIRHDPVKSKGSLQKIRHRKYRSNLPKIEEFSSHMLKKSITRPKDSVYLQEMSHIKKVEELDLKQRKRNQRAFRRKMNELQVRLDRLRTSSQD